MTKCYNKCQFYCLFASMGILFETGHKLLSVSPVILI